MHRSPHRHRSVVIASLSLLSFTASLWAAETTQTPWQTNAYGTLYTNQAWNYALGYHFTPQVDGQITQLGGFFNGTKTVRLFNKVTGELLASTSVSAANTWAYTPITPVKVTAGTTYTVAVYLAGSGTSYRSPLSPPLPRTFGDIRIEGTTFASTSSDPNARPTNLVTTSMYGQADIGFVRAEPTNQPPVANAGSDQTVASGSLVRLDGSSSNDPDGDPLSYAWLQSAGSTVTFSDPNSVNPTFTAPTVSVTTVLSFELTVSDGSLSTSDSVTITVTAASKATQTPWQTNAYGTLSTNIAWNYAMGYHFTPLVNGQITQLGGFFNGTKTVKLFNKATGTLLASATVTASNAWSYASITPVSVTANTTYTVAVYLAGSGGSYRSGLNPTLPRTFGDIRIEGSTYVSTSSSPTARPTNTVATSMYGQADIQFVPATTDTTPPTGTVSINSDAAYTNTPTVTLSLSATDNSGTVTQMQFSNDGTTYTAPEPYAITKRWTLSDGDGTKTVYAKFEDPSGNWSSPATDSIVLDTAAPTGTITINGGATYTNTSAVTLSLSATDNSGTVSRMQFSNDNVTYSNPEPYATSKSWSVTSGDGTKAVYAQFADSAGNWSVPVSDTIVIETTAPSAPGQPTEGSPDQDADPDGAYTIYWPAASDPDSGISAYELQERIGTSGAWASLSNVIVGSSFPVSGRLHNTRYFYQARAKNGADLWGPWSAVSDGILVDTTAPSAVTVTDDGTTTSSTTSLHATWTVSSDPESGIVDYPYLIRQDSPSGPLIRDWTSVGLATEVTATGLTLAQGGIYYFGVRAINGAGLLSDQAFSDGIRVQSVTAPLQTPWQTNAYGTLYTNQAWNYALGYHFTPLVDGQVTQLGGYFNGTKTVKLFNKTTGALLASSSVTASNTWSYASIAPVNVTANTTYTVAVYLAGSGASYRVLSPPLPQTFGDIRIEGSTFASTASDPNARPTNTATTYMYGQADIQFVPATSDTTPPTGTVAINGEATYTNTTAVTLSLSATDKFGTVAQMQFSNDNVTYSTPEAYATSKSWTLTSGDGTKTVYAKFKDAAGNWSVPASDMITLDTSPPTLEILTPSSGSEVTGAPE